MCPHAPGHALSLARSRLMRHAVPGPAGAGSVFIDIRDNLKSPEVIDAAVRYYLEVLGDKQAY